MSAANDPAEIEIKEMFSIRLTFLWFLSAVTEPLFSKQVLQLNHYLFLLHSQWYIVINTPSLVLIYLI